MKLVTYKVTDVTERVGVIRAKGVVDLQRAAHDAGVPEEPFTSIMAFLNGGDSLMKEAVKLVGAPSMGSMVPLANVHLLPPIPRPGKIVAVGLNYRDHAMESGAAQPPKVPILFAKFPNSISGPEDPILIPAGDPQVDWEAELAVVIGQKGKAIPKAKAYDYIAGYMPLNDVSAREWQFGDKQWVRGKSPDTFCPIGPHLTTPDEVPDPHSLAICSRLNGTTMQNSNTSKLIFKVPYLVEFISAAITLEPGDIIATGTPEGVGVFRKPPIFLKAGDVVEIEIERLGILRNAVVAA